MTGSASRASEFRTNSTALPVFGSIRWLAILLLMLPAKQAAEDALSRGLLEIFIRAPFAEMTFDLGTLRCTGLGSRQRVRHVDRRQLPMTIISNAKLPGRE